ncbi:MAG TPA: ribosome maturation factor RimM [Holophagaceae bacterium]|nr:ribosome maturation factor RimM [Holophagaceae bacterium]
MLLLGHLAKVQGLKGEFLFHELLDEPEKLASLEGLVLAPPQMDLERQEPTTPAMPVKVRAFRWHQDRPCVAFEGIPDRTAAEPLKGWALWMPDALAPLPEGESYRHDWIGLDVFVGGQKVGEVVRLEPTPMGYDMVFMRDLRPGRAGLREIPYIKAWWQVDMAARRAAVDPPEGLLDLDRL